MRRAAVVAGVLAALGGGGRPSAQAEDLALVLRALAERTQRYYDRFISIICTETVYRRDLRSNLAPLGRPRETVYELSVARDPHGNGERQFRVERTLQSVNGRPARKNQQAECSDPKTGSPEPLAFLLAENQARYRFTLGDDAASWSAVRGARAIDFIETPPARVRVKWEGSCFEAEGGGHQGRIWFDPVTFDVLQVALQLSKPFSIQVPRGVFGIQPSIRVERS
jgi:hypothetical protein